MWRSFCHHRVVLGPAHRFSSIVLLLTAAVLLAACASSGVDEDGSSPAQQVSPPTGEAPAGATGQGDSTQTSGTFLDATESSGAAPGDSVADTAALTTSTTVFEQEPLPTECGGLDDPLLPSQLTYVAEGKLIAIDLSGEPVCLINLNSDSSVGIVEWGAQADRVMFTDGRVEILAEHGRVGGVAGPEALAFSWPTGFNMVWLRDGVVQKSTADDRQQRDLEIGVPVTDVVYHPDGQFLFVTIDDGPAGSRVLVTDSEGEQAANVIVSADAKISELIVASNGSTLVFSAEHSDGAIHIHALELADVVQVVELDDDDVERSLGFTDELSVKTVFEAGSAVNNIVFDASGEQIAFAVGDCATRSTIDLVDLVAGGYPLPIDPRFSARPVGFVSETDLAILVYDESCSGGDLYVTDVTTGETELVRSAVDGAAVRRTEPPARFSLVEVELTSPAQP